MSSSENSQPDSQVGAPDPPVQNFPPPLSAGDGASQPVPSNFYSAMGLAPAPLRDPVWSGWDVLLIAAMAFISMLVLQVAVLVAAKLFVYPQSSLADVAQMPILLLLSQFLIYIAVAICMFMLVEGKYHVPFWRAIHWNWPRAQASGMALGVGAIMLFVLSLLQTVLPMPKDTPFEHLFDRPRDAYLLALLAVTVGPLMEELFFRGFLYPVLARWWGVFWGVFLSAVPFGLIHYWQYKSWSAVLVITIVGVVCGVVRVATKSVASSFLVHVGYNGTQMLIALVATQGFRHMEKALLLRS